MLQGPRYFGVELEIDDGGESDSNALIMITVTVINICKNKKRN